MTQYHFASWKDVNDQVCDLQGSFCSFENKRAPLHSYASIECEAASKATIAGTFWPFGTRLPHRTSAWNNPRVCGPDASGSERFAFKLWWSLTVELAEPSSFPASTTHSLFLLTDTFAQ